MPANASTNRAPSAAIRRSQAKAIDAPAPAATPLTAAITGLGSAAHRPDERVVAVAELDVERRRVRARAAP